MLYNGLVKFIMRGMDSIEKKNIQEANNNIIRAQNIISEFMNTLDMKYELSSSLYSIYDYMLRRLVEANVSKTGKYLRKFLGLLRSEGHMGQAMKISTHQPKKPAVSQV